MSEMHNKKTDKTTQQIDVQEGTYHCTIPLIRPSKLTTVDMGGIGKDLSEGWCLNFAVGCTHACPFCYVDAIHKRFGKHRYGDLVNNEWGTYLLIPENIDEAIEKTNWKRWKGKEVIMSSTHDPYLPQLSSYAQRILKKALPAGVRFCIQTRSALVLKDIEYIAKYKVQVRLQISIATLHKELSKAIEPRVPTPQARLRIIKKANEYEIPVGVIVAPILPEVKHRPNLVEDISNIFSEIAKLNPNHVYGETIHTRGSNLKLLEKRLGYNFVISQDFDERCSNIFKMELEKYNLTGTWWPK